MISTISARSLVLGAVFFGLSLSPSFATSEGPGEPGPDITESSSATTVSTGHDGSDGGGEQANGYDGGNGGDITITSPGSNMEGVSATSTGGNGGAGADAAQNMCFGECDPEPAGDGGNGGHGGNVSLTLDGASHGDLRATSQGGAGGMPGEGSNVAGAVGNGGSVIITVATGSTVVGDVVAESLGGTLNGMVANGHGGDVTVTISGTVTGKVETRTDGDQETAGAIKVVIDGGVVTGVISAGQHHNSSLTFKFEVADRTEFNAAATALTGPAAGGTVTINDKVYEWAGFHTLVNLLSYVGPDDKVVVSVTTSTETTNVGDAANAPTPTQPKPPVQAQQLMLVGDVPLIVGKPEMAKCSGGSEIRTVRLDDGSLVVIHHSRGTDSLIGKLADGEFRRASDAPDWTIQVGDQGKSVQVSDATGNALSNCSFS